MNHLIDALIEGVTYGTAGNHFFGLDLHLLLLC